jgi:glycosyltransferase involved in cell wall biosynthesis
MIEKNKSEMFSAIDLSIVVPIYNEEDSIRELIETVNNVLSRIEQLSFELILVDDGSIDGSWGVIEQVKNEFTNIRGIKFKRNFGQTAAMVAGIDNSKGDVIITMDGDLQNDPLEIPKIWQTINEGYDIVSGWRKNRKDHWSRVWPSKIANKVISTTTGVRLHDYGCSLKGYRSSCIKPLKAYGEMHRFLPALSSMTGARIVEIPVNHLPRRYGSSKYGFSRIFKVLSDIFAINLIIRFSSMPLKGFSFISLPFCVLALFFAVLSISADIFSWSGGKAGYFAILSGLNLMAVVSLISLGIVSELAISYSDLSHTELPEVSKEFIGDGTDG